MPVDRNFLLNYYFVKGKDGVPPYQCPTRFSCAGFVFEAYKRARITLLDLSALPLADMAVIAVGYPQQTHLINRGLVRAGDLGLDGDGPWPVLLCGYLFHALNRDPGVVREDAYIPDLSDRHFP